jgi:hypothetical protein
MVRNGCQSQQSHADRTVDSVVVLILPLIRNFGCVVPA